jgi:hypothetical protein
MRSSFWLLARHFFGRLFDNDIVSQTGDMRTNVVQVLGLVAAPGILVPFFMLPQPLHFDQPFAYNWLLVIDCYFFVLYRDLQQTSLKCRRELNQGNFCRS